MARTTRLLFLVLLLLEVCPVICPCYFCNRAFYRYNEGFGKFCHSTRLCIVLGSRIFVAWLYVRCIVSVYRRSAGALQGWVPRGRAWRDVNFFRGNGAFGRLVTQCFLFVVGALAGLFVPSWLWRLFVFLTLSPP